MDALMRIFEPGMALLLPFALGYLLGSIPFGLLITKFAGMGDVRSIGSGNIGATNVLRTGNKGLAAATLIADMAKGFLPVWIGLQYGLAFAITAGFGAFIGHCFPAWLKFKGGKGVATYIGVLAGLAIKAAIVFAVTWLAVATITRYSSLSALIASLIATLSLYWLGHVMVGHLFALMTLLIFVFHKANILRLLSGTEGKIGNKT